VIKNETKILPRCQHKNTVVIKKLFSGKWFLILNGDIVGQMVDVGDSTQLSAHDAVRVRSRLFQYDIVGVGDGRAKSLLVSYETWTVNGLPGMSSVPQRMTSVWSPFSGAVYETW